MRFIFIKLIELYQLVSKIMPPACRFYPSCSQYSKEALTRYGSFVGIRLTFMRLVKCHPLHPGGYDPLP